MRLLTILFCLFLTAPALAQTAAPATYTFLRLEPSARAAAMGGSFGATYGDDVNAFFYNPALLNEEMDRAFSASYLNHVGGLNAGFVAFGYDVAGIGTVAGGLRFLSYGSFEAIDERGVDEGTFGANNVALSVGFGSTYVDNFRYGASAHFITAHVADRSALAAAFDAGIAYVLPETHWTVSASVHNVGRSLTSLGESEDLLPMDLRLSVSKRLANLPLLISVTGYDLHQPGEGAPGASAVGDALHHVALGGEFQFSDAFQVRFGYNHRRHEELRMKPRLDLAGTGLGFGLRLARVNVDYAFNTWSSLGGLHQFTVRTRL
jgi:hypothetical protein